MTTDAGSYEFEDDPDTAVELERLKRQAEFARPLERRLLNAAGLRQGMTALDMGCGPGLVAVEMADLVGSSGSVTGVDISDTLLATARRYATACGADHIQFQRGNVYELDLPKNHFDFAYTRFFVQHLERPGDALDNIRRVLKPGGTLCVLDIDDGWLSLVPEPAVYAEFNRRSMAGQAAKGGDRHVGRKLGRHLQKAGFVDAAVDIVPVTSAQLGMEVFLDLAISPKWKMTAPDQRDLAHREYQEICELVKDPHAWGFLGLFLAMGTVPASTE